MTKNVLEVMCHEMGDFNRAWPSEIKALWFATVQMLADNLTEIRRLDEKFKDRHLDPMLAEYGPEIYI